LASNGISHYHPEASLWTSFGLCSFFDEL
jgi:hypothetical protein